MPIRSTISPTISVIMPAFYEEAVIASVIERVHTVLQELDQTYEIIVVDDGSQDETARRAHEAGARVIAHPYNIGNGAAIKSGIRHAQGEILIMLDADGQHLPEDIPRLLEQLQTYDMVVGARTHESDSDWHRDLANKIYNWFASYVCGRQIDDLTSGFRAMKGHIARGFVYLLPNTFSYPTTLTLAVVRSGYTLRYVPIKAARRVGKSKIKLFKDGPRFLLIILKVATFFSPLKVFIPASIAMFAVGVGYGLFKVLFLSSRYGPTSAMLMTVAVLVFLVGLVSEQVAQLRFEVRERAGTQEYLPILDTPYNHIEKVTPEKETVP
ncbi:MAG: glycosyltransferase family 2 protein [Anaerolineae bacterium]|nr:glycosyltransferase family 2 protein [Anaerolineae bacterium]